MLPLTSLGNRDTLPEFNALFTPVKEFVESSLVYLVLLQ